MVPITQIWFVDPLARRESFLIVKLDEDYVIHISEYNATGATLALTNVRPTITPVNMLNFLD